MIPMFNHTKLQAFLILNWVKMASFRDYWEKKKTLPFFKPNHINGHP